MKLKVNFDASVNKFYNQFSVINVYLTLII